MKHPFQKLFSSTIFFYVILFYFILFLSNCGKDNTDPCIGDFSQEAMYENMADRIILPAYLTAQNNINNLRQKATLFEDNPNVVQLNELRAAFSTAWLNAQAVTPFGFGPSTEVELQESWNSFPVQITLIEQNINDGSYNLNEEVNQAAKGFAALDYLLYGLASNDAAIAEKLQDSAYNLYLFDVIADMKFRIDFVLEEWEDKGYRSEFIKNTGTAEASTIDLLVEGFYESYWLIKVQKIGQPAGIVSAGNSRPDEVEALYSGLSLDLTKAAVATLLKTFKGGTGEGLDDYLVAREAKKEERPVNLLIEEQLEEVESTLNKINGPYSESFQTDFADVEAAYMALEQLEDNLSVDMPLAFCVNL